MLLFLISTQIKQCIRLRRISTTTCNQTYNTGSIHLFYVHSSVPPHCSLGIPLSLVLIACFVGAAFFFSFLFFSFFWDIEQQKEADNIIFPMKKKKTASFQHSIFHNDDKIKVNIKSDDSFYVGAKPLQPFEAFWSHSRSKSVMT